MGPSMTRRQYKSFIERELRKLNERIDISIMQGFDYRAEARRHKVLLSQIKRLKRREIVGKLFGRIPRFASFL